METKRLLIILGIVLIALPLVQTASALSVFVHNLDMPIVGAEITYTVYNNTTGYTWYANYTILPESKGIEIPLPEIFHENDMISVGMNMTSPYYTVEGTNVARLGDGGMNVTFSLGHNVPYDIPEDYYMTHPVGPPIAPGGNATTRYLDPVLTQAYADGYRDGLNVHQHPALSQVYANGYSDGLHAHQP